MALTDGKERTRATDPEAGAALRADSDTVGAITVVTPSEIIAEDGSEPSPGVPTTIGVAAPIERPSRGAVHVASPVRQPRRFDALTAAYGVALFLATVAAGLTVGAAEAAGDAGSPYAPPPAVFVQTD